MKVTVYLFLLSLTTLLIGCNSGVPSKEALNGKWLLEKQETENQQPVTFDKKPTQIVLDVEANGYFLMYDTLIVDEWANTGVPRKQERARGQWELKNHELILNHLSPDKNTVEHYSIDALASDKMVLSLKTKSGTVISTYSKK